MHIKCWSCGRKVSNVVATCEFCGVDRQQGIRFNTTARASEHSGAIMGAAAMKSDTSTSFGFWSLMLLLLGAVWDLAKISIVGGLGYVLFFTGWLADIPFWVLLPIRIYLTILGFLLYFKPSIVAWNLNRDLRSYPLFSLVLGEKVSYAIQVMLRFILVPIFFVVFIPIFLIFIPLQYALDPNYYVERKFDYRAAIKSLFFPEPLINETGQLKRELLEDGIIISPNIELNSHYYTGIKARIQHRYFVVIFFVNVIFGATGVIWLATHVFAHMGLWMHQDEFEQVLENGLEAYIDQGTS